ncbi:MAG: hypothetical protein AUJ85_00405 [Elusimicrobia bacterium CG1_02_37_114]|nr:MAG: hypothetical protein AUJ85_00405 [Elusimicrobia bacterium CG1_02_37_114]PIV53158.1 MAG: hypothetical protein COS17_05520 [Elusimicrobia bacterium CG02_land_8_20_14_3_00_37_13]PIZ13905.1 MAG: hypothetical protein COY53_02515 [Elusimicrobia bacterium CG_4_10_14_0_8_um_filter_37_32]
MLCNICKKNDATIFFKGIFDNQVVKINLCEECAKKKGIEFKPELSLPEIIATLSDLGLPIVTENKKTVKCKSCGLAYTEFKERGRLGCADCYNTFESYLAPLIERIHGKSKHTGKKTAPTTLESTGYEKEGLSQQISLLKKQLNEAVKSEEYEKAAELRDKIRELEKKQ